MSNSSTYVAETDGQLQSLPPVMKSCALGAIFHKIKNGDKSLAEEVKSLTGMAVCIDNAFEDVKGKLTKAELPIAADEWVGLQKRFRGALPFSRKFASDIVHQINKYNDVVIAAMNDPEASREDKRKMIMTFMENKMSSNDCGDFRHILEGASEPVNKFQDLARDVHIAEFPEAASEADEDIKQIKIDLETNDGLVSHLWAFGIVWNSIAYEANKLVLHLDDIIEDVNNYAFNMEIKLSQDEFAVFNDALNKYVELIDNSGIGA